MNKIEYEEDKKQLDLRVCVSCIKRDVYASFHTNLMPFLHHKYLI
jgi:hypothetical protein